MTPRVPDAAVDALLAGAREGWDRLTASQAYDLPGAVVIDRTVLEWRLDPTSE